MPWLWGMPCCDAGGNISKQKKTIKGPEQKKNKGPLPKQKKNKRTTLKTKQKRDQFCKEKKTDHNQRSDFPV